MFCIEFEMSLLFRVQYVARLNLKSIRVKTIAKVAQVGEIVLSVCSAEHLLLLELVGDHEHENRILVFKNVLASFVST